MLNFSTPSAFTQFSTQVKSTQPLEFKQTFFEHYLFPGPSKLTLLQIETIVSNLKTFSTLDRVSSEVFVNVVSKQSSITEQDAQTLYFMHQVAKEDPKTEQADIRSLGLFLLMQLFTQQSKQALSLENKAKDFNVLSESRSQLYTEGFKQSGFSPMNSPRAKTMRVQNTQFECQHILHFLKSNIKQILKIISFNYQQEDEKCVLTDKIYNLLSLVFKSEKGPISQFLFDRATRITLNTAVEWTSKSIGFNESEIFTLSGFTKSVTCKNTNSIPSTDLRIFQCDDSYIFIDHPINTLIVQNCTNCVIFVSSVKQVTSVAFCDRLTLCLASTVLRVCNTIDSTFYYFGSYSPILYGDSRNITLGPHNGNTLKLLERVREAGIPICKRNAEIFKKPQLLQGNQAIDYSLVTAEDLNMLCHPEESFGALNYQMLEECGFDVDRIGKELTEKRVLSSPLNFDRIFIPPLAPIEYQKTMFARYKLFSELQTKIKLSGIREEDAVLLQQAIQGNFREWLINTGQIRPITDLVKLIDDQN